MGTIGRDRVGQDMAHLSVGHGHVSSTSNLQSKSATDHFDIIFSQNKRTHYEFGLTVLSLATAGS